MEVFAVPCAAFKRQRGLQIVSSVLSDIQSAQLFHPQLAHQHVVQDAIDVLPGVSFFPSIHKYSLINIEILLRIPVPLFCSISILQIM